MVTWREVREPAWAMRSTWQATNPPEFLAAMARDRFSSVRDSRSTVTLPSGSAVVPRMKAT